MKHGTCFIAVVSAIGKIKGPRTHVIKVRDGNMNYIKVKFVGEQLVSLHITDPPQLVNAVYKTGLSRK